MVVERTQKADPWPTQTIPSHETRYVGLHFSPLPTGAPSEGDTKVLVFVNNEDDKNEECMEIALSYSAV